jgi:hypothetical protein
MASSPVTEADFETTPPYPPRPPGKVGEAIGRPAVASCAARWPWPKGDVGRALSPSSRAPGSQDRDDRRGHAQHGKLSCEAGLRVRMCPYCKFAPAHRTGDLVPPQDVVMILVGALIKGTRCGRGGTHSGNAIAPGTRLAGRTGQNARLSDPWPGLDARAPRRETTFDLRRNMVRCADVSGIVPC